MTDDTKGKLAYARGRVVDALLGLAPIFTPGAKLTFIMRIPGNDAADFLISDDQMDEVVKLVQRRIAEDVKK